MDRLRIAMEARYRDRGVARQVYTPGNLDTLDLPIRHARIAEVRYLSCFIVSVVTFVQVIGRLAKEVPREGDVLSGLLVAKDCSYTLLDAQDLQACTGLVMPVVMQKQRFEIGVAWELVRWHLEGMFGSIEERVEGTVNTIRVGVCDLDGGVG